ncbi:MAG: hypothetical protein PHW52_02860 [Candidatus Pacebacteria bacterium]|nr:hypothetical protein [Candidatus Paceibacterota bacterium]
MTLSSYHQNYSNYPEEEIQKRVNEKEAELKNVFEKVSLRTNSEIVRLAVMGSGDKRFIKYHKEIFEKFVNVTVEVITLDITVDHLIGEENIIKHDCTLSLPLAPYDITYAHVLLKFIEIDKQWDVIINSYNALKDGGIAIHVLDKEDYSMNSNSYISVPIEEYIKRLQSGGIVYFKIPVKYGITLVLLKKVPRAGLISKS